MSGNKAKHGGARVGAGRKKTGKCRDAPHRKRPALSSQHPVHVVLRVQQPFMRLRRAGTYSAIRGVLTRYLGRADFRVVHVSIQHNHLHFLVEASSTKALTRGMRSLAIATARAINRELGRIGRVFAYRYHATQITMPRHARNALAYVLNNWRRHREDFANGRMLKAKLDPYASGFAFDGWAGAPRFAAPADYTPLPVSPPATSLLRHRWKRYGPIELYEQPGPLR